MPIPAEKLAAWIEALRSGKYKQGKNALCRTVDTEKEYCCLGVFLEAVENLPSVPREHSAPANSQFEFVIGPDHEVALLPWSIAAAYQISANPKIAVQSLDNSEDSLSLTNLNDSGFSLTFSQIADMLEHFELIEKE